MWDPVLDLQLIVDSAPALIHTGLPDGYLDFFNQTWLSYVGRSVDLLGWKWTAAIHPDDLGAMLHAWRAALASGEPFLHEARVRRADGEFRWMLHHKIALRDGLGNIVKWFGSSIDIEERKRSEEALRESEERYRALVEVSPQMVWTTPGDGWTISANQWWYEYTGLTRPETEGFLPIDPDHRRRIWKSWRQTVASGSEWIEEAPLRRAADGQYRWHLLRGRPMRDADGRIVRWIGIAIDIHDRREAEEALRESEERYRALIEVSPQMIWMARADGSNTYFNQWWYDYTGLTQAESEGFGWAQVVHPEHRDRTIELWREHVASDREWTTETPVRRAADGQYRWHLSRGVPIRDADGRVVRWIGVAIDIHDRRETEEARRRSEAWLSEAQRLSHTGNWATNRETRQVVYASNEFLRIMGFAEGEGIPSTEALLGRIHPDDRPGAIEEMERGLRETTDYAGVRRLVLPDGAIRYIHYVAQPAFDAAGHPVELIGTVVDVTERRRAEEALRESEERYRNIFETVGVAIIEEDFSKVMERLRDLKARGVRDFRRYLAEHPEIARETLALVQVTDANDAALGLFSAASKEEFLAGLARIVTPEMRAAWNAQLLAVAEGRHSVEEVLLNTLRGEKVHTLVTIVLPPQSSCYKSVLVTVVDLSERKRSEEALRQAQAALTHVSRVATVGEVSASIAHEVNQPLGAIANNASACLSLLSSAEPKLDEVREALADIVSDAERASATIERVRGLAKRSAPERIPVRLSDLVHEVVGLAAAESATRRVAIRTEMPAELPLVLGDRVELQQVLLNLVVNAMDAMSGVDEAKRTLEIRGLFDELDGHPSARISVQDRGIGLRAEQADRLFEPFYTTKAHGMGLGLAISRSIIEAHGGRLWAEADRGQGATFSFALPAA